MKHRHLSYSLIGAHMNGIDEHPQKVISRLGIVYEHATPQTISDEWWLWNCTNIPNPLPEYLSVLDIEPMDYIGFGLSEETAKRLNR